MRLRILEEELKTHFTDPRKYYCAFDEIEIEFSIITQILIAMDYFFYLYISDKYLQFRGKICILIWAISFITKSITKGIEILSKRSFSFSITVAIQREASGYTSYKEKKSICQGIFLVHPKKVTGPTYYGIVFQIMMYTSEICT